MQDYLGSTRLLSFISAQKETVFGKEFINVGPTPYQEDCTQAGENKKDSILECLVYIKQLIRVYGDPPKGCEFFIIRNDHDFGSYYDVNIFYSLTNEQEESENECEDYALRVEDGIDYWDEDSLQELRNGNHHLYVAKVINMKKSA